MLPRDNELRFGYLTPRHSGKFDSMVIDTILGEETISATEEAAKVIFELQPIIIAINVVEKNYLEILDIIEKGESHYSELEISASVSIPLIMEYAIFCTQKIFNFLSSANAFIEQTRKYLISLYGTSNERFLGWDNKRKDYHAQRFAYRFLYELRNYANHWSIPLAELEIKTKSEVGYNYNDSRMCINLIRDTLLEEKYDWKKVKDDIKIHPEKINLVPLLREYLSILRRLCWEAVNLQGDRLLLSSEYMRLVRKILNLPEESIPVLFVNEYNIVDAGSLNWIIIPIVQFEFVINEFNRMQDVCEDLSM